MADDVKSRHAILCGRRLRAARRATGYDTIRWFAEVMKENEDNISNWERGVSLVPTEFTARLRALFGITADWIYAGDASTMKPDLAIKITNLMNGHQEE